MNSRKLQAERTRKNIITSTYLLSKTKNFNDITIQDICQQCEIAVGTFYHHFSSKDDVVLHSFSLIDEQLQTFYEQNHFHSHTEAIHDVLCHFCDIDPSYHSLTARALQLELECNFAQPDNYHFLFTFLYEKVKSAIEAKEFNTTSDHNEIAGTIARVIRGDFFDWVVSVGDYNLSETVSKDLHRLFAFYGAKL